MPVVERTRMLDPTQIPRPPNSWILYRSDKVALLPPPQPGTARSQADVSRIISQMWKNESPEVKAEYERRAEVKKLEHAALYPNYRYMPKSKELKEELKRSRDEQRKKKRKQKDTPHQPPEISHGHGHNDHPESHQPLVSLPFPFFANDATHQPQGGPSPPMSAAESPSPEPPYPQQVDTPNERAHNLTAPTHDINPQHLSSTGISSLTTEHSASRRPKHEAGSQSALISHYGAPNDAPAEHNDGFNVHLVQEAHDNHTSQVGQAQEQQQAFSVNAVSQNEPGMEFFSFDLQPFAAQTLGALSSQHPELQSSLNQFLSSDDRDLFQMQIGSLNQQNFSYDAIGPLEIEIGQRFDFSQWQWDGATGFDTETPHSIFEYPLNQNALENPICPPNALMANSSDLPSAEADQGFRIDQFINFDPSFDFIPPTPAKELQETPTRTSYMPPAGAAQSSKRRVAASWNPAFATADPIDA